MDAPRLHGIASRLWPDRPAPIGLARVDRLPAGLSLWDGPATSACQFWREGATRVLAVGAEHGACPVGRLTMGFAAEPPSPPSVIDLMTEIGYIDPAELAHLPTLPVGHAALVYGPLRDLPVEPEAVLLLADAAQLMLLGEASGQVRLDGEGIALGGRPTCAAIPLALAEARMRGSVACVGARVYAELEPGELLVVIPAERADAIADGLELVAAPNRRLRELHLARREQLNPG